MGKFPAVSVPPAAAHRACGVQYVIAHSAHIPGGGNNKQLFPPPFSSTLLHTNDIENASPFLDPLLHV